MQITIATLKIGDVVFWVSCDAEYVLTGKVSDIKTRIATDGENAGQSVKDIDFILEDGTEITSYGNLAFRTTSEIYEMHCDSSERPGWIFLNENEAFYFIKNSIDSDMLNRKLINTKIDKKIENLTKVYKVIYGDESTEQSAND